MMATPRKTQEHERVGHPPNMGTNKIWKWITDEWFYSRTAISLFATSATFATLLFAFGELGPKNVSISSAFAEQFAITVAAMVLAMSELIVIVGMFRYWTKCDRSSRIVRRIWFAIMILGFVGLGLGCALCCFAVYLPQTLGNSRARQVAHPPTMTASSDMNNADQ